MRSRGFTLIELVMVVVITGILAATVAVFFRPALEAYFAADRRAGLTDIADTALRGIGRSVRTAVPNSVRSPNDQCFELVPTIAGGRYRTAADPVNDSAPGCTPSANCSAPLDITQPVSVFDVLSPLASVPAANDWVVIGNQNTGDVHAGNNRAAIASVTTPNALFGRHRITLAAPTQFPSGYDGGRFFIVPAATPTVAYVCTGTGLDPQNSGTGTLVRVTGGFSAAYPGSCPSTAGGAVLATRVERCSFIYNPNEGATQQSGFVWMQIDLADNGEKVSLSYGAHVDALP